MRRILPLPIPLLLALPAGALAAGEKAADDLTDIPIEAWHVNATVAHRDDVHIGMTKTGAAAMTSFRRRHTA